MSEGQAQSQLADTGRGAVGKTAVVGVKDRATNEVTAPRWSIATDGDAATLQGLRRGSMSSPGAKSSTRTTTAAYQGDARVRP